MHKKLTAITPLSIILTFSLSLAGCGTQQAPANNQNAQNNNIDASDHVVKDDGTYASDELQKKILADEQKSQEAADKQLNDDYKMVRELEDLEDAKKEGSQAKGSCNAIDDASTCLEFYGSFWTDQQIQLSCDGTYSKNPCPRDMAGGCNTGYGTEADAVAWMYTRGGGEMTTESIKYAAMACNATLGSKWIATK